MYDYRRSVVDVGPCVRCNEYLLEIGFAPGCPGCDREVLLKRRSEVRVSVGVAKRQARKPKKAVWLAEGSG